jgi:hypothetical protein
MTARAPLFFRGVTETNEEDIHHAQPKLAGRQEPMAHQRGHQPLLE